MRRKDQDTSSLSTKTRLPYPPHGARRQWKCTPNNETHSINEACGHRKSIRAYETRAGTISTHEARGRGKYIPGAEARYHIPARGPGAGAIHFFSPMGSGGTQNPSPPPKARQLHPRMRHTKFIPEKNMHLHKNPDDHRTSRDHPSPIDRSPLHPTRHKKRKQ